MSLLRRLYASSLRTKFVVPIAAILVLSMFVISGYLINRLSDGFVRELESKGATLVKMLAINAETGVLFESTYELEDLLGALARFDGITYAVISNMNGDVLARTGRKIVVAADSAQTSISGRRQADSYQRHVATVDGKQLLIIKAPIISQTQHLNREALGIIGGVDQSIASNQTSEVIGYVEVGLSLEAVNSEIHQAQAAAILLTILVLLMTIVVLAFIVNAITKPVTELVTLTDQVSRGDLSRRVDETRSDEIGHLASTFNRMINSLRQSRDEIEQYNRTLEQKIIERTQQLEEAQQQLVQSEKMSAIGQLAAGVAHELNNPLGGILGYAQFTLEKLQKSIPHKTTAREIESYIRYVRDIEAQARRCKTIVQNLLRFSRASKSVDFEDVDINRTLEETISFVEHQLRLKHIDLTVTLEPDLPTIYGNPGQLQQVFTNLIINAMHASESGTTIEVCSRYSPALGEFGGAIELLFADQGCGIEKENMNKIFEPFFTTKEVGKGTGLGLSVSYGIIKSHGGEINVNSTPGGGSTFTIVLPVQKRVAPSDKQTIRQQ